jgi:hypothetical protein
LKISILSLALLATLAMPGCAASKGDASEREWQRNECNQIIDREARERCMKRVDSEYGKGPS